MNPKTDLETNFAECVLNVGKVILGEKQRNEMDPHLQKEQYLSILHAICALLNSGGGVIKIEIANEDYDYRSHGVGLKWRSMFNGYLDEMQQEEQNLFFIFVKSWNAKASGVRLATLSSNLYQRHKTSTKEMTSEEALAFLKGETRPLSNTHASSLSPQNIQDCVQSEDDIKASADALFARNDLQYLEELSFTQSTHVEFKMFSEEELQHFEKNLSRCVSAFANTEGGYIFLGVNEKTRQVVGYEKKKTDLTTIRNSIGRCIRKLPVHHFCTQRCEIKYAIKFLEVKNQRALRGYVYAVKVEPFCCAVFAKEPSAWQVKDNRVVRLATKEWATRMIEADPDLSRLSDMVLQLSVSAATPQSSSVCTHKNLECLEELQKRHFPGNSSSVVALEQVGCASIWKKIRIGLSFYAIEKNQFQKI
ncbi:schlafen family member 5-like [Myotis lucifugus]|nr:schlafen family member 5-like [Myotis lucifugus]